MSIVVEQLVKTYGTQNALDGINFNIKSGEIVGFLGPNGAGKSTCMKIICGYLPPTQGHVKVCDFDVEEQAIESRKQIGYLPENNPLYLDMYVLEYLTWIGKLNGLGKNAEKQAKEMIGVTGLTPEKSKKIGQLSKGYRQRVGLAQAMIHNPKVLVLDEPTSGLDPNQLSEIRKLIVDIGREKTVMLSTHIMQEVEQMCKRVIIINKGKIVADDTTENMVTAKGKKQAVLFEFVSEPNTEQMEALKQMGKLIPQDKKTFLMETDKLETCTAQLLAFSQNNKLNLIRLQPQELHLEDIFTQLTKGSKS